MAMLLLGSTLTLSAQDTKETKKPTKKPTTEKVTFDVSMECHNCQLRIEKNIAWEKGVKDLAVDLEHKTVTVTYNPQKTTEEKLQKAIEKLQFTCNKKEQ